MKNTIPQYTISNIGSRGVRLDTYAEIIVEAELLEDCEWGKKGAVVDVEVQKEDRGDHEYRVYYNGASMIINRTPANTEFKDLPRAIVIYISAFDIYGEGEMLYENVKKDRKTNKLRRSPVSEFYVNTANLEKGEADQDEKMRIIAALMKIFRDPDCYDEQFPAFSGRKKELHETEKGVEKVSREIELIVDERLKDERQEWQHERQEWQNEREKYENTIAELKKQNAMA